MSTDTERAVPKDGLSRPKDDLSLQTAELEAERRANRRELDRLRLTLTTRADTPSGRRNTGSTTAAIDRRLTRDRALTMQLAALDESSRQTDARLADVSRVSRLRTERDRAAALADRAAARVFSRSVASPAYAQRLARELENAEGDYERAAYAAGIEPVPWSGSPYSAPASHSEYMIRWTLPPASGVFYVRASSEAEACEIGRQSVLTTPNGRIPRGFRIYAERVSA